VSSVRVCMWLSHPAPLAVSLRGGRTATGAARMRCSTSCASTPPQCLSPTHAAAHYHALVMPHTHTHTYAHTHTRALSPQQASRPSASERARTPTRRR
jgi:hypothetical protein